MSNLGVPVKLLHEAMGHIVTLELKTGQIYRGKLLDAEDNMNCQLREITVTHRDGRVTQLDQVHITSLSLDGGWIRLLWNVIYYYRYGYVMLYELFTIYHSYNLIIHLSIILN